MTLTVSQQLSAHPSEPKFGQWVVQLQPNLSDFWIVTKRQGANRESDSSHSKSPTTQREPAVNQRPKRSEAISNDIAPHILLGETLR
jgi:hypothetical protein